jgi:hypothetical protein
MMRAVVETLSIDGSGAETTNNKEGGNAKRSLHGKT